MLNYNTSMYQNTSLSHSAELLVSSFNQVEPEDRDRKISVNPVISKVASIYEKVRNAMDYREEEVILRAAIERILKRRTLWSGANGKSIAEPLVRELVWARYFPDESVPESIVGKVENKIHTFLKLREEILKKHPSLEEKTINEWTYHLMSSDIQNILKPNKRRQYISNFMFKVMRENINIVDGSEHTKDVQTFIAVRKSFNRDDLALLRYHLFKQIYGEINEEKIQHISNDFLTAFKEINNQLAYLRKDRILNYVRDKTVVFIVLEDLLRLENGRLRELVDNEPEFQKAVFAICDARYRGIRSKVTRAIIRSVIFILATKAIFALAIETTVENLIFGEIVWGPILINIIAPPAIMAIAGSMIKPPDIENSKRVFKYMKGVLKDENPRFNSPLMVRENPDKMKPFLNSIFTTLWFATLLLTFGTIVYILTRLNFNFFSILVFLFFLAIISFFSYRINRSAQIYSIEGRKKITTPIADFLFMPFVRVGRKFAEGISQINIFLFIFDFIIEAPFKGMFGFFEQWFLFLQNKREEIEV